MGGWWHGKRKEEGRKKGTKKDPACGCGNRDQDDDRKDQEQETINEERSDMNQTISSEQSGEQSQGG